MAVNKTAATTALIALILASAGGAAFLLKHPNPTLRDVFAACEKGEMSGIVCCEDASQIKDIYAPINAKECGMVAPGNPDPLGYRDREEKAWDAMLKKQQSEEK